MASLHDEWYPHPHRFQSHYEDALLSLGIASGVVAPSVCRVPCVVEREPPEAKITTETTLSISSWLLDPNGQPWSVCLDGGTLNVNKK